jgi:hypothetical protein
MSINQDGVEWLIPTVSDDGRILSEQQAIDLFNKTRKHLGGFVNPDFATRYAERLHQQQAEMYRKK